MFCPKCGVQNEDSARACVRCGTAFAQVQAQQTVPQAVPNYLVWAILVTLFCCLPFGIVAIVFAAQVNSKFAVGDYQGALDSSRKAKMWSWISFGLGLAAIIAYAIVIAVIALSGMKA
jgi:uncharacterized membrane protein YvbJ